MSVLPPNCRRVCQLGRHSQCLGRRLEMEMRSRGPATSIGSVPSDGQEVGCGCI